jgi:hypothetical protein
MGGRSARERCFRLVPRLRQRVRLELVFAWCVRGGACPYSRRSRLTLPMSGGGRRGQEEPVRAERSELRSSLLDAGGRPELGVRSEIGGPVLMPASESSSGNADFSLVGTRCRHSRCVHRDPPHARRSGPRSHLARPRDRSYPYRTIGKAVLSPYRVTRSPHVHQSNGKRG